eukprot:15057279-Alexandrium_andersonii.AAC.1
MQLHRPRGGATAPRHTTGGDVVALPAEGSSEQAAKRRGRQDAKAGGATTCTPDAVGARGAAAEKCPQETISW